MKEWTELSGSRDRRDLLHIEEGGPVLKGSLRIGNV
jgi:hypothetical protein